MRPSFLMCRPTFYGVEYKINPWMNVRRKPDRALALRQWNALRRTLEEEIGAEVSLVRSRPGLPDMTFAANAGLVRGRDCIPARFRYPQRAGEEKHFSAWFRNHGYRVAETPAEMRFEGEGDALFVGDKLIMGYSFRSEFPTHEFISEKLHVKTFAVALVDPYFYHLDTCFAPLGQGRAIYYPQAFDKYSVSVLKGLVDDLIPVDKEEARQFGCNAIVVGKRAIISKPCVRLARALTRRGYTVYPLDFSEFIKAGGAAKCLVLRLE